MRSLGSSRPLLTVVARAMVLAAMVAIGGLVGDTCHAQGYGGPQGAAATRGGGMPRLIMTRESCFSVPFKVNQPTDGSPKPAEVQLLISRDNGAHWYPYGTAPPDRGYFVFKAIGDGEYWFLLRTIDEYGRVYGGDATQPGLRVQVDTTAPSLKLAAKKSYGGDIEAEWEVDELNVDPSGFALHYRAGPNGPWRTAPIDREALAQGKLKAGAAEWSLDEDVESVDIRAEVVDRAGNRDVAHARVLLKDAPATTATAGGYDTSNGYGAATVQNSASGGYTASPSRAYSTNNASSNDSSRTYSTGYSGASSGAAGATGGYGGSYGGSYGGTDHASSDSTAVGSSNASNGGYTPGGGYAPSNTSGYGGGSADYSAGASVDNGGSSSTGGYDPYGYGADSGRGDYYGGETSDNDGWEDASTGGGSSNAYGGDTYGASSAAGSSSSEYGGYGGATDEQNPYGGSSYDDPYGDDYDAYDSDYDGYPDDEYGDDVHDAVEDQYGYGQDYGRGEYTPSYESPYSMASAAPASTGEYVRSSVAAPYGNAATPSIRQRRTVELQAARVTYDGGRPTLLIEWSPGEESLADAPVTLYFSRSKSGPWNPIAGAIRNTGRYTWPFARVEGTIYLQMQVHDPRGNVITSVSEQPVTLTP